jgi:hypothetical protein
MPTTVVHCRKEKFDIYIGRSCQEFPASKWANPFKIGIDGSRHEVLLKYERWVQTQPHLMAAMDEIRDKVLGCWCHPRPCHGQILARLTDGEKSVYGQHKPASPPPPASLFDDP